MVPPDERTRAEVERLLRVMVDDLRVYDAQHRTSGWQPQERADELRAVLLWQHEEGALGVGWLALWDAMQQGAPELLDLAAMWAPQPPAGAASPVDWSLSSWRASRSLDRMRTHSGAGLPNGSLQGEPRVDGAAVGSGHKPEPDITPTTPAFAQSTTAAGDHGSCESVEAVASLSGAETRASHESVGAITMRGGPSKSVLVRDRLSRVKYTNGVARNLLEGGLRWSLEAERAEDPDDARAARVTAAFEMSQALEQTLLKRLNTFRRTHPEAAADLAHRSIEPGTASWFQRATTKRVIKARSYAVKTLRNALLGSESPSLALMGGWMRPAWRIEPEDVATELQTVLGIPGGLEELVFAVGEVRNVLAHRHEYEAQPARSLGAAEGILVRDLVRDVHVVDVWRLDTLEFVCASVLQRSPTLDVLE